MRWPRTGQAEPPRAPKGAGVLRSRHGKAPAARTRGIAKAPTAPAPAAAPAAARVAEGVGGGGGRCVVGSAPRGAARRPAPRSPRAAQWARGRWLGACPTKRGREGAASRRAMDLHALRGACVAPGHVLKSHVRPLIGLGGACRRCARGHLSCEAGRGAYDTRLPAPRRAGTRNGSARAWHA